MTISQALALPSGSYTLPTPSSAVAAEPLQSINVTTSLQGPKNIVEPSIVRYGLVLSQ